MISREVLENGLTLITETMPALRSVAIGVWVRKGSRHEPPEQGGISHFIEHMVFKGTKTRSAERIAAEVDSIGGYMDAFTAKEYASFHLKVLDEHLPLAVEILGDVVQNPLFDPEEMTKEKKVICEEINMVEDTPDDLVMELFCEAFWPDHPLGRPILGTKRTVSGFRRAELAEYFARVYQPSNLVIAAAGQLEHGRTRELVKRHFSGLRRRPLPTAGRAPRRSSSRSTSASARAPCRRRTPTATSASWSTRCSAGPCRRACSRTCARSAASSTRSPPASPPTRTRGCSASTPGPAAGRCRR
jgi:predicted Zn-dependent peptidase